MSRKNYEGVERKRSESYYKVEVYDLPKEGEYIVVNQKVTGPGRKADIGSERYMMPDGQRFRGEVVRCNDRFLAIDGDLNGNGKLRHFVRKQDFEMGFMQYAVVDEHSLPDKMAYQELSLNNEIIKRATIRKQKVVGIIDNSR